MKLKILTLNIWQGGLLFDQVLNFIEQEHPDILCLQEVFDGKENSLPMNYRTIEVFREKFPEYNASFAPAFLCNTEHGKIDQGNAVLSLFPVVSHSSVPLNTGYGEYDEYPADKDWSKDPKVIQHCQVQLEARILNIFNVHGIWDLHGGDTPARLKMSEIIVGQVKNKEYVFLTGDFNVRPDTETIYNIERQLINVFGDQRTTSFNLKHKNLVASPGYATAVVDFVFVSKDLKVKHAESLDDDISDHLALLTEIEL
jgi:endonuclease/exonuclease/phosphatase family metal-dependent hydrolase